MAQSTKLEPKAGSPARYTLDQLEAMPEKERDQYLATLPFKEFNSLETQSAVRALNRNVLRDNP